MPEQPDQTKKSQSDSAAEVFQYAESCIKDKLVPMHEALHEPLMRLFRQAVKSHEAKKIAAATVWPDDKKAAEEWVERNIDHDMLALGCRILDIAFTDNKTESEHP